MSSIVCRCLMLCGQFVGPSVEGDPQPGTHVRARPFAICDYRTAGAITRAFWSARSGPCVVVRFDGMPAMCKTVRVGRSTRLPPQLVGVVERPPRPCSSRCPSRMCSRWAHDSVVGSDVEDQGWAQVRDEYRAGIEPGRRIRAQRADHWLPGRNKRRRRAHSGRIARSGPGQSHA